MNDEETGKAMRDQYRRLLAPADRAFEGLNPIIQFGLVPTRRLKPQQPGLCFFPKRLPMFLP